MQFRRISQAAVLAAIAGAVVSAAPSVSAIEGSGTIDRNTQNGAGRWEIEVTSTAVSSPTTWLITSNAGDDIAYIRVRNTLGQNTFVRVESVGTNGLLDVDAIERYDSTRNVILLNLDIYGNLGNVGVTNIVTGRVRGNAVGDITLVERQDAGNSPLTDLRVDGDLLGNVTTEWGEVTNLRVDGDFGSSVVNVDMLTRDGIRNLRIGGSCYADINANAFSVNSAVGHFEVGFVDGGDFLGTLTATTPSSFGSTVADPGVYVFGGTSADGDLVGDITFTSAMSDRILIDGSFASGATLTLPSNGLVGQVTFNANDDGGAWAGTLTVGSTTYGEGYSALPSAVGGGAAGKAPFTMHESTASPANHHYVFITGIDILDPMMECYDIPFDDEITFRLYGPASIESGTGTPAKVQINSSGWTDAFDIDAEIVSSTGLRGLKFVRKDGGGSPIAWPQTFGEYRIVPKADRIVCVDVTGEPTVVFEYYIELADGCGLMLLQNYDLNSDDDVCMEDMAEWMTNPVDLNGDDEADSADVTLLLRAIDIYQNR